MDHKKSFFILLRIVFVLFSLQFIKDAFYKWDGYSYYMRFIDFVPDLSLSFILWTIPGIIFALALWLIAYILFRIIPKSLIPVRLEYIVAFFVFIVLPLFMKRTFYSDLSISGMIGLDRAVILIIGGALSIVIIWFGYKYTEKILDGLDSRITPLVFLFVFLLILAVPLSLIKKGPAEAEYIPGDKSHHVAPDRKRPNIILVSWDAFSALDMQLYGYDRPTTPFVSEWAKDAVVFKRNYAASNWTGPTSMSMMTGQRVWTHKTWYRTKYHPVRNYENNLPRVMRDYGYDVSGFVQNIFAHPETLGIQGAFSAKDKAITFKLSADWWFYRIIDYFETRTVVQEWILKNSPFAERINDYSPDVPYSLYPSEKVYNSFLKYISKAQSSGPESVSKQPFFAWLHVFPPHDPYLPTKDYMGMFGDAGKFDTHRGQYGYFNFNSEYGPEMQADIDILRKRYDEFIVYSDRQFELFLSRLAETVDMSNTIIILSSDHGESFTHGWLAHDEHPLYEALVRVPLVIKFPDKSKGKVVDTPVSQIDLAPTILELAGITVPEWMEGRSLAPLIEDRPFESRPIFSMQLIKNRLFGESITKGTIAVWDGDYKLIYYLEDKKKLLFNLKTDPGESINLFKEKHEITQRLTEIIDNNLARANTLITQSSGNN